MANEISKDNVKLVVLANGTSVVANVNTESAEVVQVNVPASLVPSVEGFSLRPWTLSKENMTEDAWMSINPISVLSILTPPDDLADAYIDLRRKMFSGIVTPKNPKIILK